MNIQQLKLNLAISMDFAWNNIRQWQDDFAADPAQALKRSDDTFETAAKIAVYTKMVRNLDLYEANGLSEEETLDEIKRDVISEIMIRSNNGVATSTSPTSTLMERAMLAAYAEIARSTLKMYTPAQMPSLDDVF